MTIEKKELLNKFKKKLKKKYISNMTSEQYHIPADSKGLAMFKWLEISIMFDAVIEEQFSKENK